MRAWQPEVGNQLDSAAVLPGWILQLHELRLADFCRACVHELPRRLGCAGAALYLHEPAAQALRLADSSVPGLAATVLALDGDSPAVRAAREVRAVCELSPAPVEAAAGEAPAHGIPGCDEHRLVRALPLQYCNRVEGVLCLYDRTPTLASASGVADELALLIEFLGRGLHHARVFEQVNHEARVDCLTGLYNLRWLREQVAHELSRAERFGGPLAVLAIDIDGLKSINDRAGHAAGDCVLRHVATRIRAALRNIDSAARVGGDEFVVILPGTDAAGAAHVAERILRLLERDLCCFRDRTFAVTASIGLAQWQPGWSAETLLEAADRAMYQGKHPAPPTAAPG